jgi:hypothetical protein
MGHEPGRSRTVSSGRKASRHVLRRLIFGTLAFLAAVVLFGNAMSPKEFGASEGSETAAIESTPEPSPSPTFSPTPAPTMTPTPEPTLIRATITAVGDILMHKAVIDDGLTNPGEANPVYDFTPDFKYVSAIFQESDLAFANFEGTLAGPPYTGFPAFSAPDEIADALYDAGFRVIGTANNHCIDRGLAGLIRTATIFREKGFTVIGTRPDTASPMDTIQDLNGIKVGFINYTFETIGTESNKTINGIYLPKGAEDLVCSFNPYREDAYERDLAAILARADSLRSEGAEFICLSVHWGEEYNTKSVQWQRDVAQDLADGGIDLIIGHHPHVLEEAEVLTSQVTGKNTLIFYSLGNFLHNMNFGTLGTSGNAQDGAIARITLLKTDEGVKIELAEYIPTYVVQVPDGNGLTHYIVPVLKGLIEPEAFETSTEEMQASYDRIHKILGESTGTEQLPIVEAVY